MTEPVFELPNWPAPKNVNAVSTTRTGGVSRASYESFNLGLHVGDEDKHVLNNRKILRSELGLPQEPAWLDQVHGTTIIHAKHGSSEPMTADGSYTSIAGLACLVMTADCLPLLLCNTQGTMVAAIHVGWRGLAEGIVEASIIKLDQAASDIIAWTGPCIGAQSFEIGSDLRKRLGGSDQAYKKSPNTGKLLANLPLLVGERLDALGVKSYSHSNECTFSQADKYFSYRRDGQCGRMATLVWLE